MQAFDYDLYSDFIEQQHYLNAGYTDFETYYQFEGPNNNFSLSADALLCSSISKFDCCLIS